MSDIMLSGMEENIVCRFGDTGFENGREYGGEKMDQRGFSRWLKAVIAGVGICGGIIYFYVLPTWGRDLVSMYPEFADRYLPWLVILWITGIPCYAVLWLGWRIARQIGLDNSFSESNARDLKYVSWMAVLDATFFFAANVVMLLLDMSHPGMLIGSLLIVFAGIAVAVVAATGSHLIQKAARLKEENDLTI